MNKTEPFFKLPDELTQWLSSLLREENGAWVVLAVGILFLGVAIKGLYTGSIWETVTSPGFDGWLWWSRSESDQLDRATHPFNFWLTFIFVAAIGVLAVIQSFKMFGFWR